MIYDGLLSSKQNINNANYEVASLSIKPSVTFLIKANV